MLDPPSTLCFAKTTLALVYQLISDIVFEDEDIIVINKECGLVTHPGAGNWSGTLANALLYYLGGDWMQELKFVDDGRHRALILGSRVVGDAEGRYIVDYRVWLDGQKHCRLSTAYSMKGDPAKMRAEP
mgnify:CR=1 FL=1